jgi:hypothetical protein
MLPRPVVIGHQIVPLRAEPVQGVGCGLVQVPNVRASNDNLPPGECLMSSSRRQNATSTANTITEADRSVGKVSFKAVATIVDHRDALPGDNELTSPPVKVT